MALKSIYTKDQIINAVWLDAEDRNDKSLASYCIALDENDNLLEQIGNTTKIKKSIRNGFWNTQNTYTDALDKVFTDFQIYFVVAEIVQAVGRARLVNEECTVHLYSNIPLKQCVIHNEL